MRATLAVSLLFAGLTSFVSSQSIDPSSVPKGTRSTWCADQKRICPLLCVQETNSAKTSANNCNSDNLAWDCVCGDGRTPNASQYSLTIPFHVCQEYGNQCVKRCGTDNSCSANCRTQYLCGAQSPNPPNSSMLTTSTSSASGAQGTGDSFSSFNGGSSGAAALEIGQSYGLGAVVVGLAAGFAALL